VVRQYEFVFGYEDLARATGHERNTVIAHRTRGKFDPETIETVAIYLAKYGTIKLRKRILMAFLWRQLPRDPGGWKAKAKKNAEAAAARKKPKPSKESEALEDAVLKLFPLSGKSGKKKRPPQ
jgi:hypothetical protein